MVNIFSLLDFTDLGSLISEDNLMEPKNTSKQNWGKSAVFSTNFRTFGRPHSMPWKQRFDFTTVTWSLSHFMVQSAGEWLTVCDSRTVWFENESLKTHSAEGNYRQKSRVSEADCDILLRSTKSSAVLDRDGHYNTRASRVVRRPRPVIRVM